MAAVVVTSVGTQTSEVITLVLGLPYIDTALRFLEMRNKLKDKKKCKTAHYAV